MTQSWVNHLASLGLWFLHEKNEKPISILPSVKLPGQNMVLKIPREMKKIPLLWATLTNQDEPKAESPGGPAICPPQVLRKPMSGSPGR
jgi:hypothetical protein